jgi:hypothetical protein
MACIWHVINKVIQNPEKDNKLSYRRFWWKSKRTLFSKKIPTQCTVWHPRLVFSFYIECENCPLVRPTSSKPNLNFPPLTLVQRLRLVLFLISAPPLVLKIAPGSRLWMVKHGIHLCTCTLFSWARVTPTSTPGRMDGKWSGNSFLLSFCSLANCGG